MKPAHFNENFLKYELDLNKLDNLKAELEKADFKIEEQGHIIPKEISLDYPITNLINGVKILGAIGFIGANKDKAYFFIQYLDFLNLEKYTSKLKDICDKL